MKKLATLLVIIFGIPLTGCATNTAIEEAVANPARSDTDTALDEKRKPAEVLTFFRIKPGMKVLDVFAGGGYYAEMLSYVVGENGSVTLYNNNPWDNFVNQQVADRLKDNRLPNVNALTLEPAELDTVDGQYDAAIFVLGMHDLYYEDSDNGWPAIDVSGFLQQIHRLIKPGGTLGIIDHNAAAGTDAAVVGKSLHRVDPARVIADLESAGFVLKKKSGILANPDDDHTMLVFDPSMKWQSDRSVLRFTK